MQIGTFDEWNINNPNSALLSKENLECEEKPTSPRGGNNIFYRLTYTCTGSSRSPVAK